jgi:Tfp pilus assembly protein FimT
MRGVTAVELVLAIALLSILALAAVSLVPPMGSIRVAAAAKQVQSDIEYARQNSMMTGQTSGVNFVSNGSYTVYQGTVATPLTSPLTHANMVFTLSDSFPGTVISSNYTVEFDTMGAPTTGGGGQVVITSGTSSKTISVTANTGKVTIQ